MKLKKIGAVLLAAGLILSLGGCGGKETGASIGKIGDPVVKEATLSVYVPQGKNQNFIEAAAEIYNQKNGTSIKLEITNVTPGSATTQILSPKMVSGEVLPDLIFIQDMSAPGLLDQFPDGFASATEYGFYEKYGDQFIPQKIETLKRLSGGEAKGFVFDWGAVVNYYQPSLFEAAGVDFGEIKSWDEMIEAGIKIKEITGTRLLTLNETGETELLLAIMEQQGVTLLDEEGNVNLASKEAVAAMDIIQRLIDNDLVEFYAGDNQERTYQEVALIITGGWYASNMEMNFPDAKGKWKVAKMFPFSEENPGKNPVSGGSSWYIGKNSQNPSAAAQLITFALTDTDCQEKAIELSVISSNISGYSTEAADKEFEFYNNQKLNQIFKEAGENCGTQNLFPYLSDARAYCASATYEAWTSGDKEGALKKAAEDLAGKYSVKVNE